MTHAETFRVKTIRHYLGEVSAASGQSDRSAGAQTTNSHIVSEITAAPDESIRVAIARLTKTERRILLVCDKIGRLLGTITDYDIRRSILTNVSLEAPVCNIMSRTPVTLSLGLAESEIACFMQEHRTHYVPIVDHENKVIDIRFLQDLVRRDTRLERVAVIMAGGFGRRMRPYTETVPKPMLTVGGRPILFIILDQIIAEGFTKVYISIHYKSSIIVRAIDQIKRYREIVAFLTEKEPLGTAGGLSLLPRKPKEPFLLINGDLVMQVPLREMCAYHERDGNVITIATKVEQYTVPFGVLDIADAKVVGIREKPQFEHTVNIGAYVLASGVLDQIRPNQPLDMPDLITRTLQEGKPVGRFPIHEYWLDVGTPEQYARANVEISTLDMSRIRS